MNVDKPVFRIGQTNTYVQPGDYVWSDILVAITPSPTSLPVISTKAISGRVRQDGTVVTTDGRIILLEQCRLTEKVIRI